MILLNKIKNWFTKPKQVLSDEMFKTLKTIVNKYPFVIIGGSIALKAQGLLKRKCGDIDLFIDEDATLKDFGEFVGKQDSKDIYSDIDTDIKGRKIERVGCKIGSVKICIFKVPKDILESFEFELKHKDETLKLNLHKIEHIIRTKRVYAERTDKHAEDLKEILSKLKERSENIY